MLAGNIAERSKIAMASAEPAPLPHEEQHTHEVKMTEDTAKPDECSEGVYTMKRKGEQLPYLKTAGLTLRETSQPSSVPSSD